MHNCWPSLLNQSSTCPIDGHLGTSILSVWRIVVVCCCWPIIRSRLANRSATVVSPVVVAVWGRDPAPPRRWSRPVSGSSTLGKSVVVGLVSRRPVSGASMTKNIWRRWWCTPLSRDHFSYGQAGEDRLSDNVWRKTRPLGEQLRSLPRHLA